MAYPPCHAVFRATLRIHELVHIESDWTFRVYGDGSLTVEIQRQENWRERLAPSHAASDLERFEREVTYSYVSYDGVATPISAKATAYPDGLSATAVELSDGYSCAFHLVKCGPEGESWTVAFTATLCPTAGFQGHWRHDARQEYTLWQQRFEGEHLQIIPAAAAWRATIEPVVATLAPLTVGTITLEGSLMDDENIGFIVPLSIKLTLCTDGALTGSSINKWATTRDDGEQETAMLTGSWTRNRVDMIQSFEFADAPSEVFAFHGRVSEYGITGEWAVVELDALGEWEESDRQYFHLRVTEMERPWSPQDHFLFPAAFRSAVRLCLLSSLRPSDSMVRLPSALWPRVLSFCDSEWFYSS